MWRGGAKLRFQKRQLATGTYSPVHEPSLKMFGSGEVHVTAVAGCICAFTLYTHTVAARSVIIQMTTHVCLLQSHNIPPVAQRVPAEEHDLWTTNCRIRLTRGSRLRSAGAQTHPEQALQFSMAIDPQPLNLSVVIVSMPE